MADSKDFTPEQAEALIGKVGQVRNPSKGVWKGDYRVTGYALDPADDAKVKYLKAESVATFPPTPGPDGTTIPERPQVLANHLNPRWFKPNAKQPSNAAG